MRSRPISSVRSCAALTATSPRPPIRSVSAGLHSTAASKNMAYRNSERGHGSAIRRVWLQCLLLSLPAIVLGGIVLAREQFSLAPALLLGGALLLYLGLVATALIDGIFRPLQTLANVVASLREGDYSFRAREAGSQDALGELAAEINVLAGLLKKQRVRSLEATALLARIL